MAKIDRIRLNPVQANVGISPSTAAEADLARTQSSKVLQQQFGVFFDEAKRASQNAKHAKALAQATEQLSSRLDDRMSQKQDASGNPTFEQLPKDAEKLSQDVLQESLSMVNDPEVKDRLKISFADFANSKQMTALAEARNQQVSFSRDAVEASIKSLEAQAIQDTPSNMDNYVSMIQESLNEALMAGAITAEEKQETLNRVTDSISMAQVRSIMEQSPEQIAQALNEGDTLGLKPQQANELKEEANAMVKDRQQVAERLVAEQQQQAELNRDLNKQQLSEEIDKGTAGESDILKAENQGDISEGQAKELKSRQKETVKKQTAAQKRNAEISSLIKAGEPLYDYTPKQLDDHYKEAIRLAQESRGGELSLQDMAIIAANYKAPLKSFQNKTEYEVLYGQEGLDASRSIAYMSTKNPIGLEKLDNKVMSIASMAQVLEENGVPGDQALRQARVAVLDAKDEDRQLRAKEYKEILKEDNNTSTKDIIRELLVDDGIFDFTGDFDDVNMIEPAVLNSLASARKEIYLSNGDIKATDRAIAQMATRNLGVTGFNGGRFLMSFPPEKVWPGLSSEELTNDFNTDISGLGKDPANMKIRFNSITATRKEGPSYFVYEIDEFGNEIPLLDSEGDVVEWSPSVAKIANERKQEQERIANEVQERKQELKQTEFGGHRFKGIR